MSENGTGAGGNTLIGVGRSGSEVGLGKIASESGRSIRTTQLMDSQSMAAATDIEDTDTSSTVEASSAEEASSTGESRLDGNAIGGRYFIEKEIGEGGMARVFSARHSNLGRVFALKQIHADLSSDATLRKQFLREARLASSLSHPNIVSVVDFGEDPEMGAYMVMELLDGAPLSDRFKRKNLMSIRQACDFVSQIADALHYIHGKGIVHCDVKPENILLCKMPTKQRRKWSIKLLDFGLAHAQSASQSVRDAINGTPPYMAPETVMGHAPTPSSDIYSLGIVLYQLVTGRLPFDGHFTEVMRAHVAEPPPNPSDVCDREIDERLENLILKALAKDPKDRHPDMGAFIFELQTLMDMLGFGHRRGGRPPQTEKIAKIVSIADLAFDIAPLAMAVIRVSGNFEATNQQFKRFLFPFATQDAPTDVTFEESVLRTLFPSLLADLKQCIHRDVCQVLNSEITLEGGEQSGIALTLSPMSSTAECVLVSLVQSTTPAN